MNWKTVFIAVVMLLSGPVYAEVTAQWESGYNFTWTYSHDLVSGGTAIKKFRGTSDSGYIDVLATVDATGDSRVIKMWVEEGEEYSTGLRLSFGGSRTVSFPESCFQVEFDAPAFDTPATVTIWPLSNYCPNTVTISGGVGGGEVQLSASDGRFADYVRVTWNPITDATGYEVYRCTSYSVSDCGTPIGSPGSNGFNDTDGEMDTVYYYRIKACTLDVCGEFSSANPGHRHETDSCETATSVGANSTTAGEIEIGGDVDYFRIELDTVSLLTVTTDGDTDTRGKLYNGGCNFGVLQINNDSGYSLNFLISRDLAEGAYWVGVSHNSEEGTGTYEFVSETAPSFELPGEPGYVNASEGTDDEFVLLDWPPGPLALSSSYNLYRSDTLESEKVFLMKVWASPRESYGYEAAIPDLTPGIEYYFWVFSENSNGESTSGVSDIGWRGISVADAPESPTLDSATPGIGQIVLGFTANGDGGSAITGFTATCGAFDKSGSSSPITVSGLTNDVEYSCTVVATNVIGDSPPSNVLSATPSAPDPVFQDGFEDQ
jgi:hypothetical protein